MQVLANSLRAGRACALPILAAIALLAVPTGGFAQTTNLPFSDTFENYPSGTPLIGGTNGWYGSSSNIIVQSTIFRAGTQAVILPTDTTLSNRFQSLAATNVWVQFDSRPTPYAGTNDPTVDTNAAVMLYVNSNGYIVVHDGSTTNPAASTNWLDTTSFVGTNGTNWVTLGIYEDFTETNWDLYVNGILVTNNLGFINTALTNFTGFEIYEGSSTSYLDNVSVKAPGIVTVSPTNLYNLAMLGVAPSNQNFTITAQTGVWDFVNSPSEAWLSVSPATSVVDSASGASNVVVSNAAQAVGSYTGQVTVIATNADGFRQSNSVTVRMDVANLQVSPTGLINNVMLDNTPTQRTFNVTNAGAGSFTYTVVDNAAWLSASSNGGTLGANSADILTLTFSNTAGWTSGESNATITVASSDGGGDTQTISVLLNVMDLQVSPTGLTNNVMVGNTPPARTFNVTNAGAGSFTYTVVDNAAWLSTSSNGGTLGANSADILTLTFSNTAGWTPGESNATITVASSDGGGDTQTISVLLNVMSLQVLPAQLTNNVMKGLPSSQTFNVANPGSGVLSYTISTNGYDWVSLSQVSGALTNAFTNTITVTYSTNLSHGTTTGLLTVASSDGGGSTQYVALSVNVNDLLASPSALTNNVLVGYIPSAQSFTLANPGPVAFTYTLATNANWIACSDPALGALTGPGTNPITVNYGSTSNWSPGISNAAITIAATNYGGATQTVAIVLNVQELLPPSGVTASDGTYADKVLVTWDVVTNAASYQVWRNTANDSTTATNLGETTSTTFDDTNATQEVTYYYWLKSTNSLGVSAFSTPDTGFRSLGAPPAPTGLTASDGAYADKVALSWTASSNAVGYEVWRNTSSDTSTAVKISSPDVSGTSYNDTSASSSLLYTYWVKAKDSNDIASAFSASDTGWRGVLSPTVSASKGLRLEINVTWSVSPGATSYELWKNSSEDSTTAALLTSGTALAYRDLQVTTGVRYYYWVKAIGDLGDSGMGTPAVGWSGAGKWDFSGDGRADPWYYHEPSGRWYVMMTTNTFSTTILGGHGFAAVPADYDGDGKTDMAVYDEDDGIWQALLSGSGNSLVALSGFGASGYAPAVADYDGDGKADPAIYADASGTLQVLLSANAYQAVVVSGFGGPGYSAVPANYDDDGKSDPAFYEETSGNWLLVLSGSGYQITNILFGQSGYAPVAGEYDGLGYAQIAVYHEASGNWYIRTGPEEYDVVSFGQNGYLPMPADYDGDKHEDEAVFYRTGRNAFWYLLKSTEGFQTISGRGGRPH